MIVKTFACANWGFIKLRCVWFIGEAQSGRAGERQPLRPQEHTRRRRRRDEEVATAGDVCGRAAQTRYREHKLLQDSGTGESTLFVIARFYGALTCTSRVKYTAR
jgi:hypothetical protein